MPQEHPRALAIARDVADPALCQPVPSPLGRWPTSARESREDLLLREPNASEPPSTTAAQFVHCGRVARRVFEVLNTRHNHHETHS